MITRLDDSLASLGLNLLAEGLCGTIDVIAGPNPIASVRKDQQDEEEVKIRVIYDGRDIDVSTRLSTRIKSFVTYCSNNHSRGYYYTFGDRILSTKLDDSLSSLGLNLLAEGLYGTIKTVAGQNPLHGIRAKFHETAIRRLKNKSKAFDSLEEFLASGVTHEIKPRFIELLPLDKPYTNYFIVKCFIQLDESMEIDEFDEPMDMEFGEILDEPMETESIPNLQDEAELEASVHLTMSEQCHTVYYSGISARVDSLIDRFYENSANYSPFAYGMLRIIDWTSELANLYNFESTFQAVLATELYLSTWDDVFAKVQRLGIQCRDINRKAWQKILDMEQAEFDRYVEFVYNAASNALFSRNYEK